MMRVQRFWVLGLLIALLSAATAGTAGAQESPPSRVGRLSYIGGSVSFEPAGTQAWAVAELNRPVTIGDRVWTDWDSRAEIELGDVVVRLGARTGFSFLNLDARTAQMQLTAGTIIVRVRSLQDGEQDELDTPNLALSLDSPGIYRIHVFDSGQMTRVEVISGHALASGGGQTFPVDAQQSATFSGANTLSVAYTALGEPDALDDWSMSRDRAQAEAAPGVTPYVPANMVGVYDLDTYGSWEETSPWGYAWFPNVVAGWAPYRFGHWVWIFPWGWTWVDEEPWGFAPFHYGRWAYWHDAWCWVPGRRDARPVYTPAQVVWMRGGHPGRPGFADHPGRRSGPHVGWLPLGPKDVYLPGYSASRSYLREVNISNARGVNASSVFAALRRGGEGLRYGNRDIHGAVTAVPRSAFAASRSADAHRVVFTRRGLLEARFAPAAPAVVPTRLSVFGSRIRSTQAPRQLTHRPVVALLLPARAAVSFERQQAAMRASGGRPLTAQQWAQMRSNRPAGAVRLAPDTVPTSAPLQRGRARPGHLISDPAAHGGTGAPPPPSVRTVPSSRADRPAWARSPGERRGRSLSLPKPFAPVTPTTPARRESAPRAQPRPRRHVPMPRFQAPPATRPNFGGDPHWRSAPPMYRAQPSGVPERANPAPRFRNTYAPPRSPPPMYRPVAPRPVAEPENHPAPARSWHPGGRPHPPRLN